MLFIQETNFRTPLDVAIFRREHQVDAFFSLTNARACGVGVIFVSGRFRERAHCVFGCNGRTLMTDIYIEGKRSVLLTFTLRSNEQIPMPSIKLCTPHFWSPSPMSYRGTSTVCWTHNETSEVLGREAPLTTRKNFLSSCAICT